MKKSSGPDRAQPHLGPGPIFICAWGRMTFDKLLIMKVCPNHGDKCKPHTINLTSLDIKTVC